MKRTLLLFLFGVLTIPIPALAGIYGTLAGRVTDNEGKSLAGATVRIEGTTRGAKTKADGKYTVTNISAGTYTASVTFTGFKKFTKQVVISADQTTDMNVKLVPDAVVTEGITVTAKDESKMVDEKRIGTIRSNQGSDNVKIARENVQAVAALNAGVQTDGGGFVVRGSRANQTQIRVDGLDVGDQFTGGFGSAGVTYSPTVSSFAVEEVQVLTGGFGAEYGNALGGVVNTVVKTGRTNAYEGVLRYRTDVPGLFGSANNGIQLQGKLENQYDANFGGPIPLLDGSTFFIATKYATEQFRSNRLGVIDPIGNNLGQMPNQKSWVTNVTGRLKFVAGNIALNVGGQFGLATVEDGGWDWLYAKDVAVKNLREENGLIVGDTSFVPVGRAKSPVFNQNINNIFARINHQISDELFYEFTVSLNQNISKNGKRRSFDDPGFFSGIPIYEPTDEFTAERNPERPFEMKPGKNKAIDVFEFFTAEQITSDRATKRDFALRNHLTGYIEGAEDVSGTQNAYGLSGYFNQQGNERLLDYRDQNFWQFDGNFNALFQTGDVKHAIKTGFDVRLYENRRHYNSLPWDANGFFDIYTDEFGGNIYADSQAVFNETSKAKKPMAISAYVQDQITYRGIIINPGLRFDLFAPNSKYRPLDSTGTFVSIKENAAFPEASMKAQISPRISIAYPITERSNMTLSYGIYFQMPQMNYMFDAFNVDVLRGNSILGNPNQEAQRTNQYQVSLNNQLSDDFSFDIVAYYKDNYNMVGLAYVPTTPVAYYQYVVAEYGNSRGVELTLRKRPNANDHIGLNLNYTLAFTNTSSSNPESNYNPRFDPYTDRPGVPLSEFPFSSDRRHYVKAMVDFVWNKDEGPSIGGIKLLENTNINFTTEYRTGTPFTLLSPNGLIIGEINGNRHPSFTQTDMRLQKTFYLNEIFGEGVGPTAVDIFVDVLNIFNRTQPFRYFDRSNDPDFDNNTLNRQAGDFSSTTWFKEASATDAASTRADQYDRFGNRLYNAQADFNADGAVTQLEKYSAYLKYVENYQQLRVNYQAPRQVFVGAMIRF